jgi:hypothetical protein
MSHILACVLPHKIGYRGSLREVVSSAFGVTEEYLLPGVDPEDNVNVNLHEISRIVEECRIVVVDERDSTLQAFGVPTRRARRMLVMSIDDEQCSQITTHPVAESILMRVAGEKKLNLTRTCVVCYASIFAGGFAFGIMCVCYGVIYAF